MSLEEFTDLLDRVGAASEAWPPGAAAGAARLLQGSPEARAVLKEAQSVEAALKRPPAAGLDVRALAVRAMARPQSAPAAAPLRLGVGLAAAAAVLSLGILAGARAPAPQEEPGVLLASSLSPAVEVQDAE